MSTPLHILTGLLAVLLYLGSAGGFALGISRQRLALPWPRRVVIGLGLGAVLAHAATLYPLLFSGPALHLGLGNALSLIAMLAAGMALLSMCCRPLEPLGVVLLPIAALSMPSLLIPPADGPTLLTRDWGLDLHIVLSLLAYSLLALSALQALLFAYQESRLRHRHPGGLVRLLPPLRDMERLLWEMLQLGFFLLSLSLLSGLLFLEDIFAQHLVHKTALSAVAWVVYGILLAGHWRRGWRGQVAVRWAIGGFIFLVLGYFGSKFVLEFLLGR